MAEEMNEKFLAVCREGFDQADANKDGTISLKDLGLFMKAQGRIMTQEEVEKEMAELCEAVGDKDGSGTISFDEFAPCIFKHKKSMKDEFGHVVEKEFKKRDIDNTGKLTFEQVMEIKDDRTYLCSYKEKMSTKDWEKYFKKADVDGDGAISIEELVSMCFLFV